MTKSLYNKRAYLADIAANNQAAAEVRDLLESFNVRLEAGEPIADLSDAWNAAHDRAYEIEQEREDIERRFSRRRWTAADYSTHSLVVANID